MGGARAKRAPLTRQEPASPFGGKGELLCAAKEKRAARNLSSAVLAAGVPAAVRLSAGPS